ncbi:hypothetical protein TRVL_07447 [Trypanosoma vivax]|nr:hypothetical protein TRVL_07447 [Trypanosoma vivax]
MVASTCSSNNAFSLIDFLFLSVSVPFRKQTCNTLSRFPVLFTLARPQSLLAALDSEAKRLRCHLVFYFLFCTTGRVALLQPMHGVFLVSLSVPPHSNLTLLSRATSNISPISWASFA